MSPITDLPHKKLFKIPANFEEGKLKAPATWVEGVLAAKPIVPGDKQYLVIGRKTYELTVNDNFLWVDESGTVWGFRRPEGSFDKEDRCGIWPFVLPSWMPFDCAPHDYMYESPAWQYFHTREYSDEYLEYLTDKSSKGTIWNWMPPWLKRIAHYIGPKAWENKKTR